MNSIQYTFVYDAILSIINSYILMFICCKNSDHSGGEGHSGDKKLIIDMPYIFEMVKQNAIQIH